MYRSLALLVVSGALLAAPAPVTAATPAATQTGRPEAPAAPVLLKSRVVIDGSVVRLGDLFEGLDERADTAVARAPEPGRQVEVDARWLAAVAQAYALPWRPKSRFDKATIERASHVIEAARIADAMMDALAARGVSGRVSVLLDNPSLRLHLPRDAAPTLRIAGLSYDPSSRRFSAQVIAPADGTPLAQSAITGRAVEMTEIPVLGRRILPGEIIRQQDIEWISVRADRLGRNTIAEPARLLGMSPRRPIRAGEAVLGADLREPVVVAKNSMVTIRLESPRMVLTVQGRALEQGAAGDVIRVINTKSNMVINAAVAESGLVRVFPATLAGIAQEGLQ